MKKIVGIMLSLAFFTPTITTIGFSVNKSIAESVVECTAKAEKSELDAYGKSAYLVDYESGTVLYEKNPEKELPIASMCKIMTLILCFDEIKSGNMSMEDTITVGKNASSMGGSQVFLEENGQYFVKDLIKSIVVCSANDSCVAMAEKIAGSESDFVDKMNEKAKELGATHTLYANCTGLPKDPQYSCAKDVAIFLRELLKNDEYFTFSKIWMDRFEHPKGRYTDISNTNKLIRYYEGCDGGKTGFTNQAGFCLACTAKRGGMRLISVAIGEDTSEHRFQDIKAMLDYGFNSYTMKCVVDENNPIQETATVQGGKEKVCKVRPATGIYALETKNSKSIYTYEVHFSSVKAPVHCNDKVGEIIVYKDGVEYKRTDLLAFESVKKADYGDNFKRISENWCF